MRSFSQGRDIPEEKKFVRTVSHGQHAMPDLAGSPETREKSGAKLVSVSSGEVKRDRHSHSGKCGRPKKGTTPIMIVKRCSLLLCNFRIGSKDTIYK